LRHRFTSPKTIVRRCLVLPLFSPCYAIHPLVRRCRQWRRLACLLLLGWAAGGALSAFGQGTAAITGTVRDPAGLPVEFATITLHDAQGAFSLGAPAGGRYLVSVAQVGYERYWSAPFELLPTGLVLPVVGLRTSAATALQEVKVVGQKPLFEHQADRTIVNVENSPLAAGNTALDVLTRAPGVSVDGSDNLALRGRQGLLVVIDGKRQPMTGTELADYLRTLPAEQLATIELITNPPASYDAQGTAGVIAINLKKDQRQGANGSLNLGYGRGVYGRFTTGATGNYRRRKVNAYGAYTYADRRTYLRLTKASLAAVVSRRTIPPPAPRLTTGRRGSTTPSRAGPPWEPRSPVKSPKATGQGPTP
jgi:ferric enterobactin receptor